MNFPDKVKYGSNPCSNIFVADFVYFWALFGAIIRNINVQKQGGGGQGPFEQC